MGRQVNRALANVPHRTVAWILALLALVAGIIGLIAGLAEETWKLGAVGWFTGATAVAVLAVFVQLDRMGGR